MKSDQTRAALLEIEATIRGASFERWRKDFVEGHLDQFTFEDENKLIYTDIHREYEAQIEKRIQDSLSDKFDFSDFMASLPDYVEGPDGKDEATGKAITLLLEVSDFQQFRDMMLFRRREKDEGEMKCSDDQLEGIQTTGSDVALVDVDGMMDMCAQLASAADDSGWVNLLSLDWMKIDKKEVEPSKRKSAKEIYLRGVWTMNLTFEECCDMMFTFGPRRKAWDPNFTSVTFPNGGSDRDDDIVTNVMLNFGYLTNLVMFGSGNGYQLITRNFRRWDSPSPGCVTYAMVPWDLKNQSIDKAHKLLSLKTGTIAPHPSIRGKCVMTTLEINSMGGMPTWAMHFMMRATAPKMMRALESRYIANARNKNDFVDMTPAGRALNQQHRDHEHEGEGKKQEGKQGDEGEGKHARK